MRLIDADEVKKTWCKGCDACKNDETPYCEFLAWLDKVPTIEPNIESDGTLMLDLPIEVEKVKRIALLNLNTNIGSIYYPEIN